MRTGEGYLLSACNNSKGGRHHHLTWAEPPRQAQQWESFVLQKGKASDVPWWEAVGLGELELRNYKWGVILYAWLGQHIWHLAFSGWYWIETGWGGGRVRGGVWVAKKTRELAVKDQIPTLLWASCCRGCGMAPWASYVSQPYCHGHVHIQSLTCVYIHVPTVQNKVSLDLCVENYLSSVFEYTEYRNVRATSYLQKAPPNPGFREVIV